jgi:hypothetical protein
MNDLTTILTQFGLAGVVIYLFYTLLTNELRDLRHEFKELVKEIRQLREEIKLLREHLRE